MSQKVNSSASVNYQHDEFKTEEENNKKAFLNLALSFDADLAELIHIIQYHNLNYIPLVVIAKHLSNIIDMGGYGTLEAVIYDGKISLVKNTCTSKVQQSVAGHNTQIEKLVDQMEEVQELTAPSIE